MNLSKEEMNEINNLFSQINKLFHSKAKIDSIDYTEIRFEKENDFRYLNIKYRNLHFEIYTYDGMFKYNIFDKSMIEKEIIELVKYMKENFTLLLNKEIDDGKLINYTFESGDLEQVLLARCRKRNNII